MKELIKYIDEDTLLIVPNNIKDDVIKYLRDYNNLLNIKIMSIEELVNNLTFTYDEKTIYELMNSKNINYDISKLYLDNIRYVENDSNEDKLHNLFNIKEEIDGSLIKNIFFKKIIKNKNIIVYGYDYINKYYKYILSSISNIKYVDKEYNNFKHDVYRFKNSEEEVIYVAEKISELIQNGIDINNIFVSNLDNDYYYIIKRIFNMYNIPININEKYSINETNIGKFFINNINKNTNELLKDIENTFDMNNNTNKEIYKKIIGVLNKFYFIDDYALVKENIINVMKKTFIKTSKYKNAVNEINILDNIIDDNKYVFLLDFNLNSIPSLYKDEDYISDKIKPYYLEKSYELNKIYKDIYYKVISSIKNLTITYKEKHLNESFYPSILVSDYNMNVIDGTILYSKYSNSINKIKLTKLIDNLIKYNEKNNVLNTLYSNYKIDYRTYDNKYTLINKNNLYDYLNNRLSLSYTSMNSYFECSFKYYLSYILKLDEFEEKLTTYIGNLFHYILSKAFLSNFDFDKTLNEYIINNPYPKSYKNDFFINKSIEEIKFVINTIKYHNSLGNMEDAFYEKEVNVIKGNKLKVNFKGYIDKLLIKDNYVVIVDYKTYTVDVSLKYLPYGLNMQLPVYLYLTKNINKDYKVIGFYLEQVLFGLFKKDNDKSLKEQKENSLKLKGYSIGNEELLSIFDSSYMNSELIYGMKLTNNGFSNYSKVLTEKQIDNVIRITNDNIDKCIDNIENAIFDINPKVIKDDNVSCKYCKFKDICFKENKDITILEDIKDLDYLD